MHTLIDTRNPVARVEPLALGRRMDIDGRGKLGVVQFQETIHWLRECSAKAVFRHGGKDLDVSTSTRADCHYGFLSCLPNAIDDAKRLCRHFGVTAASSLTLDLIATVTDTPSLPDTSRKPIVRDLRCYTTLPADWRLLLDDGSIGTPVTPIEVANVVVWSSANTDTANAALLAAFKESVAIPNQA